MSKELNTVKKFNLNRSTQQRNFLFLFSKLCHENFQLYCLNKDSQVPREVKRIYKTLLNFMRHKLT